jgi:glutaredoxin
MSAMSKKQIKKIKIKEKKKAMKELTVFVYPGCPYCAQARKIFDKLFSDGGYSDIKLTFIDETEHPEISDKYDYNACPSIYYGDKKIYEAKPLRPESKAEKMIKQALDSVEQMEE